MKRLFKPLGLEEAKVSSPVEAAPVDVWPTDRDRRGPLFEKGDRTRCVSPILASNPSRTWRNFFSEILVGQADDHGNAEALVNSNGAEPLFKVDSTHRVNPRVFNQRSVQFSRSR